MNRFTLFLAKTELTCKFVNITFQLCTVVICPTVSNTVRALKSIYKSLLYLQFVDPKLASEYSYEILKSCSDLDEIEPMLQTCYIFKRSPMEIFELESPYDLIVLNVIYSLYLIYKEEPTGSQSYPV